MKPKVIAVWNFLLVGGCLYWAWAWRSNMATHVSMIGKPGIRASHLSEFFLFVVLPPACLLSLLSTFWNQISIGIRIFYGVLASIAVIVHIEHHMSSSEFSIWMYQSAKPTIEFLLCTAMPMATGRGYPLLLRQLWPVGPRSVAKSLRFLGFGIVLLVVSCLYLVFIFGFIMALVP